MESAMQIIGLEIDNRRMWNWRDVDQALEFIGKFGMNTLIFHQTDIMDFITLPEKYFSEELLWERWPVRYADVMVKRAFLQEVTKRCKAHAPHGATAKRAASS